MARIGDTIEGYVQARQMEAEELEKSLRGSGGGQPNNNLPSMYPNQPQQNLGFYVPPPMPWNQGPNQPGNFSQMGGPQAGFGNPGQGFGAPGQGFGAGQGGQSNMGDMLNDLMRSKPNFSTDVFGGQVYQSKFKH